MSDQAPEEQVLLTNEVRELLQLICQTDITELQIERGDAKIHVKRGMPPAVAPQIAQAPLVVTSIPMALPAQAQGPAGTATSAASAAAAATLPPAEQTGQAITSPMVGTFYSSPSPKDEVYVQVGDEVHPGDVVGIVEAMKMMNEIECEIHGRVGKILVQNGQPVEYGQPLMIIEPLPQQI